MDAKNLGQVGPTTQPAPTLTHNTPQPYSDPDSEHNSNTGDCSGDHCPSYYPGSAPAIAAPAVVQLHPWRQIPLPLRERAQWLLAAPDHKGAFKVPKSVNRDGELRPGSSTNRETWLTFDTAAVWAEHLHMGIGYALAHDDPFTCIDLDVKNQHNEPDPTKWTSNVQIERFNRMLEDFNSYTESSQSKQGWHIWVRGKVGKGLKRDGVEVYSQEHFIACTGAVVRDLPIEDRPELLSGMVAQMRPTQQPMVEISVAPQAESDAAVLTRARGAANGVKFQLLWDGKYEQAGTYESQSEADLALLAMLCFYSQSNEQVMRLFRQSALGARDKAQADDRYLDLTIGKVRARQVAEAAILARHRAACHERIKAVGEGSVEPTAFPVMSIDEMQSKFVFVLAKSNVALLDKPSLMAPLSDFRNLTAASSTTIHVVASNGAIQVHARQTLDLWLKRPDRLMAETVTFDPRHGDFCRDPNGDLALNQYRPRPHTVPSDAAERVQPFLTHLEYLVPVAAERERFLNWLAHIEQAPGHLPHSGYLMIAPKQGVGRNWMAAVLACVWSGHVALDFDLNHVLSSGFNGRLSRKFLAVVDEINEGVQSDQWKHSERLKSMVTATVRNINPKFGFERTEHNCCRWLLFSNHVSAIPIKDGDRRWNVIRNPEEPRCAAYYEALYRHLDDPLFIASVREWFRRRDLAGFNPGERPMLNDAKRDVVEATRSEATERALEVVRSWPCDCISSSAFARQVYGEHPTTRDYGKLGHRAIEAGIVAWRGPGKEKGRIRLHGRNSNPEPIWILRNRERWEHADSNAVLEEVLRRAS
jgi:primase-polymerase (primpol)-like protein